MKIKNNVFAIIGMLLGLAMVLMGIILFIDSFGSVFYGANYKFGADFYTEIYDVTTDIGYAIDAVYSIVLTVSGGFLILFGAGIVCFFGIKLDISDVGKDIKKIGTLLEKKTTESSKTASEKSEPVPTATFINDMCWECKSCGTKNSKAAKKCYKCGKKAIFSKEDKQILNTETSAIFKEEDVKQTDKVTFRAAEPPKSNATEEPKQEEEISKSNATAVKINDFCWECKVCGTRNSATSSTCCKCYTYAEF